MTLPRYIHVYMYLYMHMLYALLHACITSSTCTITSCGHLQIYAYTDQVCDLVLGKVPGSQVVTDVGAELSFILPSTATHHFPSLFDTLEG